MVIIPAIYKNNVKYSGGSSSSNIDITTTLTEDTVSDTSVPSSKAVYSIVDNLQTELNNVIDDNNKINNNLKTLYFEFLNLNNDFIINEDITSNYSSLYICEALKIAILNIDVTNIPVKAYGATNILNISNACNVKVGVITRITAEANWQCQIEVSSSGVVTVHNDETAGIIPRIRTQVIILLN